MAMSVILMAVSGRGIDIGFFRFSVRDVTAFIPPFSRGCRITGAKSSELYGRRYTLDESPAHRRSVLGFRYFDM